MKPTIKENSLLKSNESIIESREQFYTLNKYGKLKVIKSILYNLDKLCNRLKDINPDLADVVRDIKNGNKCNLSNFNDYYYVTYSRNMFYVYEKKSGITYKTNGLGYVKKLEPMYYKQIENDVCILDKNKKIIRKLYESF